MTTFGRASSLTPPRSDSPSLNTIGKDSVKESNSTIGSNSHGERHTHCYLCGHPLSEPTSRDHCPPKALFAPEVRRKYNPSQLITIPVHDSCNQHYQSDEEYFISRIVPFVRGSEAGDAVFNKAIADKDKYIRNEKRALDVLDEFESRPSSLFLPMGKIVKRQDGTRITRVVWKIVRGLYYLHTKQVLPELFRANCNQFLAGESRKPPEYIECMPALSDDEKKIPYGGVLDYRFFVAEGDWGKLNVWALQILSRLLFTLEFHDPWSCQCEHCTSALAEMERRASNPIT